jgi:glycosyltransferase involved in cell wall biosynthesis
MNKREMRPESDGPKRMQAPHWNVLYLPAYMPSIDYRPYADRVGGFCLLQWLLERLCRRVDPKSLLVLCSGEPDQELARREADPLGIAVVHTNDRGRLYGLADLARALPGSHIACFFPEVAFAPSQLLQRLWEQHVREGNHYTSAPALPVLASIEIFDAALLAALGRVHFPGVPPDLTEVVKALIHARELQPDREQIRAAPYLLTCPDWVKPETELIVHTAMGVSKARASLAELPEDYEFEAMEAWRAIRPQFESPRFTRVGRDTRETRKRVLYISPWSGYSGAEECLRTLVSGMSSRDFDQFAVIGVEGLLARGLRAAGAEVFCPNWRFEQDGEEGRLFAAQLMDAATPDLVHCNCAPTMSLLVEAKARAIPVVAHVRLAAFAPLTHAFAGCDHLVAVSNFVKNELIRAGIPESRITVVYDGVDSVRFRPGVFDRATARRELGVAENAFVVLLIARLSENKRHDLLFSAAKQALSDIPNLHIVCVGTHGDPALLKRLTELQHNLGIDSNVTWMPFQEDIRPIECAADVIVLCSDLEALGQCFLEGMSMGMPVIVTDSGGSHEAVQNGKSGLVVRSGDAGSLASAMIRLAQSPELRTTLGERARNRIEREFSVESHAHAMAKVFHSLASRPGSSLNN